VRITLYDGVPAGYSGSWRMVDMERSSSWMNAVESVASRRSRGKESMPFGKRNVWLA